VLVDRVCADRDMDREREAPRRRLREEAHRRVGGIGVEEELPERLPS
jgi:hypothetical protein